MATDGQITRQDLITSDAEKVYRDLAKSASKSLGEIVKAIDKIEQSQARLNTSSKEWEANEKKKSDLTAKHTKKLRQLEISEKKLTNEIKKQTLANKQNTKSQKDNTKNIKKQAEATKTLKIRFQELLRSMLAFIGVRMFFQFIKDTFNLIKKLDSLNFAMKAIIKTSKDLNQNINFLRRITNAYGAEIVATTERYINFLAAAKQSNVSLKDTQNIFETFTKVAGVLGKSTDDLRGIFLALEQMLSKGKITTEELRRQLGERLPGAMGIMATSLGVTIPQLDKMLKKGEVLSAVVLPKFAKQVEVAFGITNVKKVKTLTAANTRFHNKFIEIVNEFKNGKGVMKTFISTFDLLTNNLSEVIKVTLLSVKAFIAYKTILTINTALTSLQATRLLLLRKASLAAAFGINKTSFALGTFNKLIKANFIGILITAVTGLIYILDKLNVSALESSEAFIRQNEEFVNAEKKALSTRESLEKMADAYDSLKDKQSLSKDEQIEFNRILTALNDNMPDVITKTNNYGVAIEANTKKLRENLKKQRELAILQAKVANPELEKQLKNLIKERANYNEETFFGQQTEIENDAKALLAQKKKNLEFDTSIQKIKDQIKLNNDIISGQDLLNKKGEDFNTWWKGVLKSLKDAEKLRIRNIHNLNEEIKVLVKKRDFIDKDDTKTLDSIAKQIKAKQALIQIIKRENKASKASKEKTFSDLTLKIQAQRVQSEINANKEIINSSKTLYTDKIKLLKENQKKEDDINKLLRKDKIDNLNKKRQEEIKNY